LELNGHDLVTVVKRAQGELRRWVRSVMKEDQEDPEVEEAAKVFEYGDKVQTPDGPATVMFKKEQGGKIIYKVKFPNGTTDEYLELDITEQADQEEAFPQMRGDVRGFEQALTQELIKSKGRAENMAGARGILQNISRQFGKEVALGVLNNLKKNSVVSSMITALMRGVRLEAEEEPEMEEAASDEEIKQQAKKYFNKALDLMLNAEPEVMFGVSAMAQLKQDAPFKALHRDFQGVIKKLKSMTDRL